MATAGSESLLLRIPAMDCPVEEGQIRAILECFTTIRHLRFDLPARALAIDAPQADWPAIENALQQAGFPSERLSGPVAGEEGRQRVQQESVRLALVVAGLAEVVAFAAPGGLFWQGVGMAVAALAIGLAGFSVFRKGAAALLRGQLNISALMTVAVSGAFIIGQWPEAAMVMALYSLAELIEARAVTRARNAIKDLLDLSPPQAEVLQPDGSWASVPAAAIDVGAVIRVRPGERLALDGRVVRGHGAVDQSPVTGESIPAEKTAGDEVFAGSINQSGSIEFEVTAPASDTLLARIIHAVEEAQGKRAPTQRFVDQFARVYTPAVFVLALAVAVGTPLLFGWAWMTSIYKALVMLVIACPCALVISTPVTIVSGLASAARRGILIKGGGYLEEARKLKFIALDKTGTVTEGQPRLVGQQLFAAADDSLRIAVSLAARSDHPVSKAIAAGIEAMPLAVSDFGAEIGHGVYGEVEGKRYILGNHRWIHERALCSPELEALLQRYERAGQTVTLLADTVQVLALFVVADSIKATSIEAIQSLKQQAVTPVMLTGDNAATAQHIAAEAGINEVRANLLPQAKLDAIRAMAGDGYAVAMVGDGINDAPALAASDIGFAMGLAGTHTAMDAADVVIMNDDLRRLPEIIELSKRTHAVLWQNIMLALGIKLVFLLLALFDHATMWMAVFADMGASLLVVFNGLRLLKNRE